MENKIKTPLEKFLDFLGTICGLAKYRLAEC